MILLELTQGSPCSRGEVLKKFEGQKSLLKTGFGFIGHMARDLCTFSSQLLFKTRG